MPPFEQLVQIEDSKKSKPKKANQIGCEHCPLNTRKDLNKIIPEIKGKKLFIFGMCPGPEENRQGEPFLGRAGKLLWSELKKVGIKRKHCDVDNVVRCYSSDYKDHRQIMRNPSAEELKCCTYHTKRQLRKSQAKVYLILGSVAARQILGKEWRAGTKILWSEKLQARVYCLYHPSYFIRGNMNTQVMKDWRKSLVSLAAELKEEKLTPYAYIESKDYKGIEDGKAAKEEVELIKKVCRKHKIRVSIDLEDDWIDGKNVPLVIGTCIKKGRSRVFFCGDWEVKDGVATHFKPNKGVIKALISLLEDKSIEKVCHHGSYDIKKITKLLKCKIRSYTYDTEYASYLKDPNRKAFGLDVIGLEFFPEFGEYKTIVLPECIPVDLDLKKAKLEKATLTQIHDYISARGMLRLAQLPKKKLVLYNGADCDLTKHLEIATKNHVSLPLLKVYVDAAFIIDEMTPNGPWFDYDHLKKLRKVYPRRRDKLLKKLRQLAGKPDFNPNSPPQMAWLLADKLRILKRDSNNVDKKSGLGKVSTRKPVLEALVLKHKEIALVLEYRRVAKICSTYLDSYEECADANGGRLRTKWWMTGTATGRMSSGGGKNRKKGEVKVINLQNVINDLFCQDLCVPDKHWRKLFEAIGRLIYKCLHSDKELRKLRKLLEKISIEKDKAKKGVLNKELEAAISRLKEKIGNSKGFKSLAAQLIKKYGDIHVEVGYDQGQIEVRLVAQVSGDKNLIHDCKSGDIHSTVGVTITGWNIEDIKKDKKTRTSTKNAHFGILFGLSEDNLYPYVLQKDPETTMSEEDIRKGYRRYFKRYYRVKKMMEHLRRSAEQKGYTENIFGFKRPLHVTHNDSDDSEHEGGGAYWGNQALNTPIQGAAHQLMFMAMAMMHRYPKKVQKKILGVPGMEVHDYMGWWTKLKNLEKAFQAGKYLLEKAPLEVVKKEFPKIKWKVPLKVEGKVGLRHGDSVEVEGRNLNQMLLDMFFATWVNEEKLNIEMAKEAA